ncbi:SPOR domain-containing protein [Sphingomonas sabuli]|uniref:SPOR domain-containing protein n=1 Tax=Sphingomonas sabuli TaxID=2764186 RepID=A0A7G9L1P3_9SPHN|nr:SPOR domain-containing protein [Sphingomonas sabuli]QNM82542.1 SPOR domain-containing protein [Sphingomonas sabuli]
MTDSRTGYDEDSLPWLQEVEDQDATGGISARTMIIGLLAVLLIAALLVGGFFWLGRETAVTGGGEPELIRAPAEPYKVKPADPGGLDIAGESQTTYETSAGQDTDSRLNLGAAGTDIPRGATETPEPAAQAETPAVAEKPEPEAPAPSGGSGSTVQLGAFANPAQAERAWTALSSRFPSVAALDKRIVPFPGGTRLRAGAASPAQARQVCAALKAAGEACFIAR